MHADSAIKTLKSDYVLKDRSNQEGIRVANRGCYKTKQKKLTKSLSSTPSNNNNGCQPETKSISVGIYTVCAHWKCWIFPEGKLVSKSDNNLYLLVFHFISV